MEKRLLPILFKGAMVRAILEDHKNQTRRVIKPQPKPDTDVKSGYDWYQQDKRGLWNQYTTENFIEKRCRFAPGTKRWVRETWRTYERGPDGENGILYRADNEFCPIQNAETAASEWVQAHRKEDKWRPSIFMPRWASRITLEVTDVRVQRIRDIQPDDILAEGISMLEACYEDCLGVTGLYRAFAELWDSINHSRGYGWGVNPYCWAVTFKRVEQ